MNQSLKTIVDGCAPYIQDALETYVANADNPVKDVRIRERAYITGYLIAARNSGSLPEAHCDRLLEQIRAADGHRIIAACFIQPAPLTTGEASLLRRRLGGAGGFENALWDTIERADSTNLDAIAQGFPEHVAAYRRYAHETGYWDALVKRAERCPSRPAR